MLHHWQRVASGLIKIQTRCASLKGTSIVNLKSKKRSNSGCEVGHALSSTFNAFAVCQHQNIFPRWFQHLPNMPGVPVNKLQQPLIPPQLYRKPQA